jgi:hypothetical protein
LVKHFGGHVIAGPPAHPVQHIETAQLHAGLRSFFLIAGNWTLDDDQAMALLGQPSRETYAKWKLGEFGTIAQPFDLATRLSMILGIFKGLEGLYHRPELADCWVRKPNLAFGGERALQRMMGGQITDLAAVRTYLDCVRGGW